MKRSMYGAVRLLASVLCLSVHGATFGQRNEAAERAAIAEAFRHSLVRVEYTLRYDKGQPPDGGNFTERCPSCGRYHGDDAETAISEERPLESAGYLIDSDKVITGDLFMHPRFIEKIEVVLGNVAVSATPLAYANDEHAVLLKLDRRVPGGKPISFNPNAPEPYFVVNYGMHDATWATTIAPLSRSSVLVETGARSIVPASERGVIVSESGYAVAINLNGELAANDDWKRHPDRWVWMGAQPYETMLARVQATADAGVLRARLDLRSPRVSESLYSPWDYSDTEDDEATEIDTLCLLVNPDTVLVLSSLKAPVTARLERITVFPAGSADGVNATFTASLRDFGAFVATLDQPIDGALNLSSKDIRSYRHRLLAAADISLQGEHRIAYFTHNRITSYSVGWRRNIYPTIPGGGYTQFLFDDAGTLIVLPIIKRDRVESEDRWTGTYPVATAASQIASVLTDIAGQSDPNNVPLSEEEENRVAWLGVIMQGMDAELARQLGVSELSQNGSIGGLVTYVYPASPAAEAGLEVGDVLLRVHAAELPTPIGVAVDEMDEYAAAFPWAQLDEVPEEYFEMIPPPWPKVNNAFNKKLTEIGFGTPFMLELSRDGSVMMQEMVVTQSPTHYDAAPQYKSEPLGLTVRPLTYEVRRQLQKQADDPGVIVARIEPGSKASVAGVKPYELITAVNDQPVHSNEDFRRAIAGQTDLRLSMLRMTRSRLVKITLSEPLEVDEPDVMDEAPVDPMDGGG